MCTLCLRDERAFMLWGVAASVGTSATACMWAILWCFLLVLRRLRGSWLTDYCIIVWCLRCHVVHGLSFGCVNLGERGWCGFFVARHCSHDWFLGSAQLGGGGGLIRVEYLFLPCSINSTGVEVWRVLSITSDVGFCNVGQWCSSKHCCSWSVDLLPCPCMFPWEEGGYVIVGICDRMLCST